MHMISNPKGAALIASGTHSAVNAGCADRSAPRGFSPGLPQPTGSRSVIMLSRINQFPPVSAEQPPRILLVGAALALRELHLALLRSVPAIVESLGSCIDMYRHEGGPYALVILMLRQQSIETAEAAHFVRRRWSAARILLLESESGVIDDWLYDERVEPDSYPATMREAAIRLVTGEDYWIRAGQSIPFAYSMPR